MDPDFGLSKQNNCKKYVPFVEPLKKGLLQQKNHANENRSIEIIQIERKEKRMEVKKYVKYSNSWPILNDDSTS